MSIYDYHAIVERDVKNYLNKYRLDPATGWLDSLMDEVAAADEITGAKSGSYTKDKATAQRYLTENDELLTKAIKLTNPDFDLDCEGPEKADVLIRQFLAPLVVLRMTY